MLTLILMVVSIVLFSRLAWLALKASFKMGWLILTAVFSVTLVALILAGIFYIAVPAIVVAGIAAVACGK